MDRERGREEDEEESCWVPWTSPIIRRTVLLTRERRPGELWRAI